MKSMYSILLMCICVATKAQSVIADPSLNQATITNVANINLVVPPSMPIDQINLLKIPVRNVNMQNAMPAGCTKIKIGLGSKLIIDPTFNINTANTSAYFNWTVDFVGGQLQLTGDQIADLPADYDAVAIFNVKGIILGTSTITANFLVTNHNSPITLSDENGANNLTSQGYIITAAEPVPVKFLYFNATKADCAIAVNFATSEEVNLNRYEIEYSTNGNNFIKVADLLANVNKVYQYKFGLPNNINAAVVFVRVKSIDNDGRFEYTNVKTVKKICDGNNTGINMYPNPIASSIENVTIEKKVGFFNGRYQINVFDFAGRSVSSSFKTIINSSSFSYHIKQLSTGSYFIKIASINNFEEPMVLQFIKL